MSLAFGCTIDRYLQPDEIKIETKVVEKMVEKIKDIVILERETRNPDRTVVAVRRTENRSEEAIRRDSNREENVEISNKANSKTNV